MEYTVLLKELTYFFEEDTKKEYKWEGPVTAEESDERFYVRIEIVKI